MQRLLLIATVVLAAWAITLRGRLRAAEMRADMYRDAAARLDRRIAEMGRQG